MHYGVVERRRQARALHADPVAGPAPAARHGVHASTTRSSTTAAVLGRRSCSKRNIHAARFHPELPSRFGIDAAATAQPKRSAGSRPSPTYVLHFLNAYEEGDEIVMDGYFQENPTPLAAGRLPGRLRPHDGLPRRALVPPEAAPLALQPEDRPDARRRRSTTAFSSSACSTSVRRRAQSLCYSHAPAKPGWFLFTGFVKHDLETGQSWELDLGPNRVRERGAVRAAHRRQATKTTAIWSASSPTRTPAPRNAC